jgi:hypothetical protein
MARGTCPDCEELVEIIPGEPLSTKPGFSARRWYPVPHHWPGTTIPCPGDKKPI